jgi:hypothetical protein
MVSLLSISKQAAEAEKLAGKLQKWLEDKQNYQRNVGLPGVQE